MTPKIFIVDDDPFMLEVLKKSLEGFHGCTIETFASGEGLLENMDQHPNAIVLDYNLSGDGTSLNGIQVLERLNDNGNPENVPVLVLSAQDDRPDLVYEFVMKGAQHYIVKDNDAISNLKEALEEVLA
ncbi:MAG: response regulator [Bacteroidota bacterium]